MDCSNIPCRVTTTQQLRNLQRLRSLQNENVILERLCTESHISFILPLLLNGH